MISMKGHLVLIYMDDITVYSKYDREHIHHLEKVFMKCRKFGISLNPNKSNFAFVTERNS